MAISISGVSWSSKKAGFSLIEVLVSVSILLVLSGIVLSYGRVMSNSLTLANQQAAVLGMVSRTKSLSQAFSVSDDPNKTLCAYGVHVDRINNRILIFRDMVPVAEDCSTGTGINVFNSGEESKSTQDLYKLSAGFEFVESTDPNSPDLNNVVFIPPDPTVIINNDTGVQSASIVVADSNDANRKFTVKITNAGQIQAR